MGEIKDPEVFRTVLSTMKTGVCLLDRERRIAFWNDGAQAITGYLPQEVLGRACRENILAHCNDQGCVLCGATCPITPSLQDGKALEARILIRHKEGHRIPVRLWAIPIRDQHGSVIGMAQSFDEQKFASDRDRQQHTLAAYGCLDDTTGIPNHSFTEFQVRENLATFEKYHLPFGIMLIEVDHLQEFRNAYGRDASRAILRVVAQTIRNTLRPSDFIGRWGEERFLGILLNSTRSGVAKAGERIRKFITYAGLTWWGDQLSVTTSIGYTAAEAGDDIESLVGRAQQSLQQSYASRAATPAFSSAAGSGSQ